VTSTNATASATRDDEITFGTFHNRVLRFMANYIGLSAVE
jgi:hypothetical protein